MGEAVAWPPRVSLVAGPTPLVRPHRTADALGIDLWIKRDDLTGVALSGNKVRKLEFLAAEAQAEGADTLVTCGGVNSNHARATAVVAARLGARSHLVLRGEDRVPPVGNLLLDRFLGAQITFIDAEQWKGRDAVMDRVARRLTSQGRQPYVIPEGGSNALGSLGYALAAQEALHQADQAGIRLRRIVHATGSGGTTAGLALGMARAHRGDVDVWGVAVCDDRAYFDARVRRILDEAVDRGWATAAERRDARWTIVEGFKGLGYARATAAEMREHAELARTEGLFVDPVYTGKAFRAVRHLAGEGALADGATVFLHTGGIFELFAFGAEIAALPPA